MGLQGIIDAVEAVNERDGRRQETFREEFEAYEAGELEAFDGTREAIADERERLADLRELLDREAGEMEELVDETEFLTVEQAVRHREESIEKLAAHNEHLRTYCDEVTAALDAIEGNLDALEREGPEAVTADPQPHVERARAALEAHNEAVEGLDTNLTILNAYLL